MIINARLIDNKKLELLEDAKKGDTIDLNALVETDLSFLDKKINEEKEALYQKNINERFQKEVEALKQKNDFDLNNLKKDNERELDKLKTEKDSLIKELNDKITSLEKDKEKNIELAKSKLENDYQAKLQELTQQIKTKDVEKNTALKLQESTLNAGFNKKEADYKEQYQTLNNEFKMYKVTSASEKKALEDKFENDKITLNSAHQTEVQNLKQQISNLQLQKSSLNVKKLGEELERWCNEEYTNYALSGFKNCSWEKDNDAIKDVDDKKGTKADYIFKVFLDENKTNVLASVCCEMKNEDPNSLNKKKNSDHYNKLDKDRTKKGCEYALLVSELEWDSANDAPIKKVPDYPKMYLVRPPYFVAFLSIIYSLAEKYRDIILAKDKEDLNLKDKQTLMEEFDALIETYINKPIEALNKKVEDILKNASAITSANQKIIDTANEIINKYINTIKEKINTLQIKKLPKFYNNLDKANKD